MSVIERIRRFDEGMLKPQLKLKYKIMAENPFRFLRGTAGLFYDDMAGDKKLSDSPVCWLCGDMHIENFGSFKGDNKLVYFDVNDFDEALLGPVAWDLIRAVSSIYTAFYALGIPRKQTTKAAKLFIKHYSDLLSEGKPKHVDAGIAKGIVKQFLDSTRKRSQKQQLKEMTCINSTGKPRLKKDGKTLSKLAPAITTELSTVFNSWMESNNEPPNHFKVVDIGFQSSGTGSLGSKRFLFLIRKKKDKKKYRLIEMKQATPSAAAPYATTVQPPWRSEADRVVSIQKRMQYTPPAQLSTLHFKDDDYIMQQMQPSTDKVNFGLIKNKFGEICQVMKDMAVLIASAHLRSAGRDGSCPVDDLIAFGRDTSWQEELLMFGKRYAGRIKEYYTEFCKNYKKLIRQL